ncbi:hypothetical protein R3P38DRAFT_510201 [Favolaschia claudopus]|uniref:Cytochrome b n=1 Tax=Favolaschia claudopus TaxID=2862362 RepID=A0AAV9ZD98_9AGAR
MPCVRSSSYVVCRVDLMGCDSCGAFLIRIRSCSLLDNDLSCIQAGRYVHHIIVYVYMSSVSSLYASGFNSTHFTSLFRAFSLYIVIPLILYHLSRIFFLLFHARNCIIFDIETPC